MTVTQITTVKFSGRIGFGENADTEHLIECLRKMQEVTPYGVLLLDFKEVTFFYPSALNIVFLSARNLMDKKRCLVSNTPAVRNDVNEFLVQSGFASCTGVVQEVMCGSEATYMLKNFTWVNDHEIDKILNVIQQQINLYPGARNKIMENMAEIIGNTMDHSNSDLGCFVMAQAYPGSKRIRYCIGDRGIGIRDHLTKTYPEMNKLPTSEVILYATGDGVTGNKKNNSGQGLFLLKEELVRICGGSFRIISGDGMYEETFILDEQHKFKERKVKHTELPFYFQGTFVDIVLQATPEDIFISLKSEMPPEEFSII